MFCRKMNSQLRGLPIHLRPHVHHPSSTTCLSNLSGLGVTEYGPATHLRKLPPQLHERPSAARQSFPDRCAAGAAGTVASQTGGSWLVRCSAWHARIGEQQPGAGNRSGAHITCSNCSAAFFASCHCSSLCMRNLLCHLHHHGRILKEIGTGPLLQ